jgi:hypothetical protein
MNWTHILISQIEKPLQVSQFSAGAFRQTLVMVNCFPIRGLILFQAVSPFPMGPKDFINNGLCPLRGNA